MNRAGTTSLCLRHFAASAAALFLAGQLATAGQQQNYPGTEHRLETTTELVKLDVSVLDKQGNFVDGLEQKSFRIVDGGVERPILFFSPVTSPAKIVMVLETSPAVYLFQDEHTAAAYLLLSGLATDDEVALVTYADVPQSVVLFTTDKQALVNALSNTQYTMGMASLNLYDSIGAVVDGISVFPGKKAIVLLTTGLDSSGPERWDVLTQKLRRADVVIFSVGLGGLLAQAATAKIKSPKKHTSEFTSPNETPLLDKARNALASLASMTGGRAYFPATAQEFEPAYREIASSVRHQYVLGIAPEHDGKFHSLTVEVRGPNGAPPKKKHGGPEYRVSAREGYIAPGP